MLEENKPIYALFSLVKWHDKAFFKINLFFTLQSQDKVLSNQRRHSQIERKDYCLSVSGS